jgi:hypothetical protein
MKSLAKSFGKKKGQKIHDLVVDKIKGNSVLSGFKIQNSDVNDDYLSVEFAYVANDYLAVQVSFTYRTDIGDEPTLSVVAETINFKDKKGRFSKNWETIHEVSNDFDLELDTFDDVNEFVRSSVESVVRKTSIHLPGLKSENSLATLFVACEFDGWLSNNSRVILGIFSTEKKAIKAFIKLYGDIEKNPDGGDLGFSPKKNPNDVVLKVITASIDEVDEL